MIYDGKVSELACLMLAKNYPEIIVNDGKLGDATSDYLVALQNGFLPIHCGASFQVKPYRPHQFSGQFGFWQQNLGVLLKDPHSRAVSYEDALYY